MMVLTMILISDEDSVGADDDGAVMMMAMVIVGSEYIYIYIGDRSR